jgi:hypothetical protein
LAYRRGTPLLPIRIDGLEPHYPWIGDDQLLPHLLGLLRAGRTRVQIQAGPAMHSRDFKAEDAWVEAIRQRLGQLRRCA